MFSEYHCKRRFAINGLTAQLNVLKNYNSWEFARNVELEYATLFFLS